MPMPRLEPGLAASFIALARPGVRLQQHSTTSATALTAIELMPKLGPEPEPGLLLQRRHCHQNSLHALSHHQLVPRVVTAVAAAEHLHQATAG